MVKHGLDRLGELDGLSSSKSVTLIYVKGRVVEN
jgi:hypothetical protein